MSDVRLQLESIKGKRPNPDSNLKEKLIAILKEVLQPNASLNPTEAAAVIDDLAPKFREADRYGSRRKLHMEPAIENFMTQLWELLFEAMQLVPPEHLGHTRAISMLHALCQISGDLDVNTKHGPLRWRHLPCLTRYLLEGTWHWTEPFDEREWLNLMSFAARLLGSGLIDEGNGVWDLEYIASHQLWHIGGEYGQRYLESDLKRDLALGEEWITHAGATILQIARRNFYKPNVAHPRFFTRCRNMFNIRNWEHWQRRLLGVAAEVDGDLSSRCLMLAHKMELLERD